jgi:hypothetical protein
MAFAKITRQWDDGNVIVCVVGCDEAFPDAVDECVAAVARLDGLVVDESEPIELTEFPEAGE